MSSLPITKTSNYCPKATRRTVAQLDNEFRGLPQFCVATIDFGTTHCSVNYLMYPGTDEEELIPLRLDPVNNRPRVPNCILFGKEHGKLLAFGYKARIRHRDLRDEQRPRFYYFEHVKKAFQHQEDVNRNTTVKAKSGENFFLLDVIAQTLFYIKSVLMGSLRPFKRSDVDWVITVPAIWRAGGKQMMREAAYKAGLCSDDNNYIIDHLRPAGDRSQCTLSQSSPNSDRLSLALEPESAAIQCQKEVIHEPKCYVVADIGGGTVDIACHKLVDGYVEEVHRPVGNEWGGTKVNEEFKHFLERLVNDPGFSSYVGPRVRNRVRNNIDLDDLVYGEFEAAKITFGSDDDETEEYVLRIHSSFWGVYKGKLRQLNRAGKLYVEGESKLRCTYKQMTEFFQPSIAKIYDKLKALLSERTCRDVDTVYWVGGYGECKYLRKELETKLVQRFSHVNSFFCPLQPHLAVVRGASAFRSNPNIIRQRKSDATYGCKVRSTFIDGIHNLKYRVWSDDQSEYKCENLFSTFVEVGESICTGEVFVHTYIPSDHDQQTVSIGLYSSPNTDISYVTDGEVRKMGEIQVLLEGEGLDRQIEVILDFTHTEIQVRAYQKPSGKEYKTVVDFLTQL